MKTKSIIRFGLGFAILALLLYKIGIEDIASVLKNIRWAYLIPTLVIYVSTFAFSACKIDLLLKSLGHKINFLRLIKCSTTAWAVGVITPAKLGEFSLVYFLKENNVSMGKGAALSLLDRIISVCTISFVAVIGVIIYFTLKKALELGILLLAGIIIGVALIKSETVRGFIKRCILKKYSENFRGFTKTFFGILNNKKGAVLGNTIITLIKGAVGALVTYSLFLALGVRIDYYHAFFISAITSLVSLVPITISGLGIKEASTVYLFNYLAGIETSIVAGVALLNLIIKYCIAALVLLFLGGNRQFGKNNHPL